MHSFEQPFIHAFIHPRIDTNLWVKPPCERKPWEFTPSTHSLTHSFIHSFIQTFEWNNLVRGNLESFISFSHSLSLFLSVRLSFFVSFCFSLSLSFFSHILSFLLFVFSIVFLFSASFLSLSLSHSVSQKVRGKKTSGLDVVLKKEAKHDRARHRLLFVPGVLRLIDFVRLREEHCQTWWTTGWWR